MQPMIRLALLLLLFPTSAFAADFEFKIDRVFYDFGVMSAMTTVTNTSGKNAKFMLVHCTFLDASNTPIDIGNYIVSDMPPGEYRHGKASIPGRHDVSSVSCKPSRLIFD